jgi:hypothetical protein
MAQPEVKPAEIKPVEVRPAPQGTYHAAARNWLEVERQKRGYVAPKPEKAKPDPLRAFSAESAQMRTDLYHWHQFTDEEKAEKLKGIMYTQMNPPEKESEDARRARRIAGWRVLSYIIWLEADPLRKEESSRSIADGAFAGLWKMK